MESKIAIFGDWHGEFPSASFALKRFHDADIFLQCGDFGYWPNWNYDLAKLKIPEGKKLYFCDGNHEDHDSLRALIPEYENIDELKPIQLTEQLFYVPRGCIFTPEGTNIVCMAVGGAYSIDKAQRTMGVDWFQEEQPTYAECKKILDHNMIKKYRGKIDILFSHTIPHMMFQYMPQNVQQSKIHDNTCQLLTEVILQYQIKKIFNGHWHHRIAYKHGDIEWVSLSNIETRSMKESWIGLTINKE
jgi:hypothetical protein